MIQKHTISVKKIVKESLSVFKRIWKIFIKYSFFIVLLSYAPTVYRLGLDTLFSEAPLYFVLGMALLIVLYILFIYYSIRFTMASLQKLKATIEYKPFEFKENFKKSEDKFWRALYVMIIKGLIQGVAIAGCFFIYLYVKDDSNHGLLINSMTIIPLVLLTLTSLYFSFRIEFYLLSVYWQLDEHGRDFRMSMNITKKQPMKKLLVILIAQLPTLSISGFQMWHQLSNFDTTQNIQSSWLVLIFVVLTTVLVFSWSYVVYYVMLSQMGYMPVDEKIIKDEEGREWICY